MDIVLFEFLLLTLCGGHALADYGLQSAYVAENKVRTPGNSDWVFPLLAHSLMHGVLVAMIVFGLLVLVGLGAHPAMVVASILGWAEIGIHFAVDHAKGKGRLSYRADQGLHYGCKVLWAAAATGLSAGL